MLAHGIDNEAIVRETVAFLRTVRDNPDAPWSDRLSAAKMLADFALHVVGMERQEQALAQMRREGGFSPS